MSKNFFKSIGAVVAGFVSVAVISILLDVVFETTGVFPGATHPELYLPWMLIVALVYRSLATIIGGYVTARLAPRNPMNHVRALMVIGFISGTAGAVAGWSFGNHWYPVLLAITGPLFVWVGGILYQGRKATFSK